MVISPEGWSCSLAMKRCNKQSFHASSLPLSLSVPIRLVKAGTMPTPHWCSLAAFMPSPCPEDASISQQGRYELAGTVMATETRNSQPFPSAWKKPKGRLRSRNLLPVSLRQLQFDMLGRGRVLQGSRDTERKHRVLCQELDRNWRLSPSAEAGHAVCSANLKLGLSSFVSLLPPRAGLHWHSSGPSL